LKPKNNEGNANIQAVRSQIRLQQFENQNPRPKEMKNCNSTSPRSIRWARSHGLSCSLLLIMMLFSRDTNTAYSFAPGTTNAAKIKMTPLEATNNDKINTIPPKDSEANRRSFLSSILSTTTVATLSAVMIPQSAVAAKRYILNDETGEYIEQNDEGNWQAEWKSRYDQMQTMTKDEIFVAARGAGNIDQKDMENESPASRKRRAFSGCRDKPTRAKIGGIDEKSCTKRVLEGDINFVLDAL